MSAACFYILNRMQAEELPAACVATLAAELEWDIPMTRVEIEDMKKRGWLIEQGRRTTNLAPLSLTQEGWKTMYLSIAQTERPLSNTLHYLKFDSQFDQYAPGWLKVIRRKRQFKTTMGFDGKAWQNEAAKFPGAMGRKRRKMVREKPTKVRIVPTHDQESRILLSGGGTTDNLEQEARTGLPPV